MEIGFSGFLASFEPKPLEKQQFFFNKNNIQRLGAAKIIRITQMMDFTSIAWQILSHTHAKHPHKQFIVYKCYHNFMADKSSNNTRSAQSVTVVHEEKKKSN